MIDVFVFSGNRWKYEKSSDNGDTWTQAAISQEHATNCPDEWVGFANTGACAGTKKVPLHHYIYESITTVAERKFNFS